MLFHQITARTKALLGSISWIALPIICCFDKLIPATYVKTGNTKEKGEFVFVEGKNQQTLCWIQSTVCLLGVEQNQAWSDSAISH